MKWCVFIFMISLIFHLLSLHNVSVTWVVLLSLSLLGYWSYPNEIDCCALLLNYKNLMFDLLLYGVKYLMALEYLVSQQCENLNLMEVEDY